MKSNRVWLMLLLAFVGGCNSPTNSEARPRQSNSLAVLFIGNSLTYWNELPGILVQFADSAGVRPLYARSVAYPDYSLEDHWNQGDAVRAIRAEPWDVVVLQQGPSALPESRVLLLEYTKRLADEVKKVGARPALYMVWPSSGRQFDFEESSRSYQLAAESVNGMLFPVGEAWRSTWRVDPTIQLYSQDGLHPSVQGSYLAAAVMFQLLYDRTPLGLPARVSLGAGGSAQIPDAQVSTLQRAAADANAHFGVK